MPPSGSRAPGAHLRLKTGSLFRFAALVFCSMASLSARALTIAPSDYIDTFTGVCADCTGTGVGTLTLTNYVPGAALTPANFVSFTYASNLLPSFSITGPVTISGALGFGTGAADVSIDGTGPHGGFASFSTTAATGQWQIGEVFLSDFGDSHSWSGLQQVPLPALWLFPSALAALGWFRRTSE
jgi:hypothetical protein